LRHRILGLSRLRGLHWGGRWGLLRGRVFGGRLGSGFGCRGLHFLLCLLSQLLLLVLV
jgi:hypothetical protein